MLNKALFKRAVPFLMTFALGLFVASFFVSIVPNFGPRNFRNGKRYEMRTLRLQNEALSRENDRLSQRLRELENNFQTVEDVPPPPPMAPKAVK